jgi:magnesium-transporting ATPase (P-type)
VKAYKSRTFDEEITGIDNQEGTEGISNKLKVDVSKGISGESFPDRTNHFGNNYRAPLKAKTFCRIFFEALDDFMLKVLLVAATLSLICEYIAADEDHYATAWFDAAAIYLAVLIVSGFSSLVDWRKEREFVGR